LDTTSLPANQYAAKGLLEDLYPYIDSDSELSRENLVQPALKAMEIDGKLYQATPSFSIYTLIGSPSMVGSEPGWTFEDLTAVSAAHPEASAFSPYVTRDTILYYSYMFNENKYVDWENGKCSFDSPDFISLLEFAASFPESYEWSEEEAYIDEMDLIAQGKAMLMFYNLYGFDDIYSTAARLGGDVTYIGFPTSEGCGSAISPSTSLAISSESKNKDAAWAFIRTMFTEDYQVDSAWQFPTNKALYDKMVKDAMTNETVVDESGATVFVPQYTMSTADGSEIEVFAMTQDQYDEFEKLLSLIDSTVSYDNKILEIIQEDAALFFNGQKSAEEAAKTIQSRVSIYVNE
ncbi:MAG: extracellular solute-binding protein, partial [Bacillota bacterium]|nr:extracellular solute-binding protein [Bacillota bacterium]